MSRTYPLMLDLVGKTVVIVGGGAVAVRKAKGVLEAGGAVTVISPTLHEAMPVEVRHDAKRYERICLEGATLVFAATDDAAVNAQVVRDAGERKILVNRADADDAEPGDFLTPARWTDGVTVVTVSAGSAALAARLRDGIAERWDTRWTELARAMAEVRPAIIQRKDLTQEQRARIFRQMASEESMRVLTAEGFVQWSKWAQSFQQD